MTATILWSEAPQGSDLWLEHRRGVCTASRFKDARDRLKNGAPSAKLMGYAYDLARERAGGIAPGFNGNQYTRAGQDNEPMARMAYEIDRMEFVETVGFAYTNDRKFGVSADGLIGDDGVWECKMLVASERIFTAIVEGDISEYRDQCLGAMWLLHRKWVDLTLWAPDLPRPLHVVRIQRDEAEIDALVADLLAFDKLVNTLADKLRNRLGMGLKLDDDELAAVIAAPAASPTTEPAAPARVLAAADF